MTDAEASERPRVRFRDIAAVTIGNALESYDFGVYTLFALQIGHAFFPASTAYASLMLSLATFGAGFLTRPLGAIVLGAYADRVGRRSTMLLCLSLTGASIIAMALIPSYASIGIAAPILAVIARMVQGFSLGGEVGASTAFLAEVARPERRAATVSWQPASMLGALIVGTLLGAALSALLPASALETYGWRIAFLVGGAAVPFGLWLRSNLSETLHGRDKQFPSSPPESVEASDQAPELGRGALARRHWRVMVMFLISNSSSTIDTYVLYYCVTYAQHTLHLPARAAFLAGLAFYVACVPSILIGARLSDRFGRWPINVCGKVAFVILVYPIFAWVVADRSAVTLVCAMALLGIVFPTYTGSINTAITEALPRRIRSGGFGTVYSLSVALFGGTTQLVVTWLIHLTGNAMAPAWYVIGFGVIAVVALVLFPETAPVRLRAMQPRRDSTVSPYKRTGAQ